MKKKLCCLLALLMLLAMVSACGGGNSNAPTDANAPTDVTEAVPTEPVRAELSAPDLAELASGATVTVYTDSSTGTGFFIDNQGTLVTCFHVIDGANEIQIGLSNGGKYAVTEIVDFSELYDLAVLKADINGNECLTISEEDVRQGEDAYAVGASKGLVGTFSNGVISATTRKVGIIDCLQTTAATSGGNSGGPLLNKYGEVVGINAYGYISGQNLNFAIAVSVLDELSMDKHWNMNQFREWHAKEISRSYLIRDRSSYNEMDRTYSYAHSYIHTYQHVTGRACYGSDTDWKIMQNQMYTIVREYREKQGVYIYEYDVNEFDQYTEYLTSIGFAYQDSVDYDGGILYQYYNDYTGYYMLIGVLEAKGYIAIEPCCE